jgi:hypothetical protein
MSGNDGTQPQGTPPVDPTKNVLDLVAAEAHYRDELRKSDERYFNAMREAETRRLNDLNSQKAEFDRSQADLLRLQVSSNAKLVSDQLDRMTTVLSDRISKLEQFRYESSGKGTGVTTVIGYVLAFVTIAITVAFGLIKVTAH